VITYLLTSESSDVFSDELYIPLTAYSNRIQQMMTVETRITDLADGYVPLPPDAAPTLRTERRQLGVRYYLFLESRRRIAADLADQSRALAALLRPDE